MNTKQKQNTLLYRSAFIKREAVNQEARTVELAFASDNPVLMSRGFEVLGHNPGEIDLEFLASGRAPVLFNHEDDEQIGVIEAVRVEGGVSRAQIRFSQNGRAAEVFADIVDGIRQNVSVGYIINGETLVAEEQGVKTYRVSWTPLEISIVSIPADTSVGIGRKQQLETTTNNTENIMETKSENTPVVEQKVDVEAIRSEVRTAEQARVRSIYELGNRFNMATDANDFVQSNKSTDEFRAFVLENVQSRQANIQPMTHLDMSAKEQKKYSLTRALSAISSKDYRKAGLELEASDEIAKRVGRAARGIFIPMDALQTRALSAGGTNAGAEFVGTDHMAGMAVSPLYANLVMRQLGATVLSGLVGNVDIPKGGSATSYWLSTETTDITPSDPNTGSITLSPKTVGGLVAMTHRLLQQSDPSIDAMVRQDLINVLSRAIDTAAIAGTAANGQPRGILNTVGIGAGSSLGSTGGAPTWALVNELISLVESENAVGQAFLTNPKVIATLKTTAKVSSTDSVMIMNDNMLVGYPVAISTLVPSNLTKGTSPQGTDLSALIFGDFSNVIIGEWGVIEVAASDSDGTKFQSGQVVVRAMADVDVGIKYPVAFSASKEIVTL